MGASGWEVEAFGFFKKTSGSPAAVLSLVTTIGQGFFYFQRLPTQRERFKAFPRAKDNPRKPQRGEENKKLLIIVNELLPVPGLVYAGAILHRRILPMTGNLEASG